MQISLDVPEQAELARRRTLIDSRDWRDPTESIPCLAVLLDAVWRGKQVRFLNAQDWRHTAGPFALCKPAELREKVIASARAILGKARSQTASP